MSATAARTPKADMEDAGSASLLYAPSEQGSLLGWRSLMRGSIRSSLLKFADVQLSSVQGPEVTAQIWPCRVVIDANTVAITVLRLEFRQARIRSSSILIQVNGEAQAIFMVDCSHGEDNHDKKSQVSWTLRYCCALNRSSDVGPLLASYSNIPVP